MWRIVQVFEDGKVLGGVESANTQLAAERAILILTAHELKNGRKTKYQAHPPVEIDTANLQKYRLPSWAMEVFDHEGTGL